MVPHSVRAGKGAGPFQRRRGRVIIAHMLRYNVSKRNGLSPPCRPDLGSSIHVGEATRARVSARSTGWSGFGVVSTLLHIALLGTLTLVVTRPELTPPPDEMPVEVVFETPTAPVMTPPSQEAQPPPEVVPNVEPPPEAPLPPPKVEVPTTPPPEVAPNVEPPPAAALPPTHTEVPTTPPPEVAPNDEPLPAAALPSTRTEVPTSQSAIAASPPRQSTARKPEARPAPSRPPVAKPLVAPSAPQTAPMAPVARAPAPAQAAPSVDPAWQAEVSKWLARRPYPEEARRRGEEGRVTVRFTVDRSGRVLDAAIVGTSGSERLDDATLSLLRQAVFPGFPAAMTQPRIVITTAVRYSLR
jgi:protein TonB